MAAAVTLIQVAALAAQLPPVERRQLAEIILRELTTPRQPSEPPRRCWRDIRGTVPYPLCGEDAQAWVSRSRREADER